MRKLFLTVTLAALVCLPALAQFRGMGMGGDMGAILLANEGVQKELKLTDEQKSAVAKAAKDRQAAFTKAREDMDREGFQTAMESYNKAMTKVKADLKPEQKKRLLGIEVQVADKNKTVTIFKNPEVVTALALTDKQKDSVKELLTTYEADAKELFDDAKGDFTKMRGIMQKVQKMGGETYTKITKSLSEKQLAAWKELQGDKFDVVFPKGGGFNPKGKDRPKKNDDN
jgi:Spy/CpxP family protein refolding chaperone